MTWSLYDICDALVFLNGKIDRRMDRRGANDARQSQAETGQTLNCWIFDYLFEGDD